MSEQNNCEDVDYLVLQETEKYERKSFHVPHVFIFNKPHEMSTASCSAVIMHHSRQFSLKALEGNAAKGRGFDFEQKKKNLNARAWAKETSSRVTDTGVL